MKRPNIKAIRDRLNGSFETHISCAKSDILTLLDYIDKLEYEIPHSKRSELMRELGNLN